jgi:NAD(P)-dependent dehydrogenase (short-subunit alcohol dehydrogenase family)
MISEMSRAAASNEPTFYKRFCDSTMMGRFGETDELNGAVVFLMSKASSYVTGEDILIGGGMGHFTG